MMYEVDVRDLIEKVKSNPPIWDPGNKEYHDKNARQKCWDEIVRHFAGDDCPPDSVWKTFELQLQKRWRNLRDNFARELNKKRYNSNHKRKSTYVYFDSLFFLSNVIKCRNESSQNTGDTSMDSEFQENAETNRNSCKLVFLQGRDDELKQEIEEADEDSNFQSTSQGWNSYVEESLEHSESKLRRIERSKSDDDDELFLLSLLGPLKKIPEHRRLYTRVEILKVIIDAQEKAGVEDPLK